MMILEADGHPDENGPKNPAAGGGIYIDLPGSIGL
jgi:hypothetical protein